MEEGHHLERWEGYVDWRKRPALKGQHGGISAASFVLVVEVLENLAYLANASNLVIYLSEFMHFSPSRSANTVTDFMGTAFLLALVGGFVSDAYFTTYRIFLLSALTEFLVQRDHSNGEVILECKQGLVILTVQAHIPSLKLPPCEDLLNTSISCKQVSDSKAVILYGGLYLSAVGVGGIKGSLPVHGAEQFDEHTPQGRKQRSTFFNYFVFCLSCGALVAVTLVVWIEDNKGWQWGFGIATITILSTIPIFLAGSSTYRNKIPTGSPLTTIAKVLAAVVFNTWATRNTSSNTVSSMNSSPAKPKQNKEGEEKTSSRFPNQTLTESLKFLNKAATNKPIHPSLECTVMQVEQVKIVLRILPIFASTIMLNCCLAQLSTFSVQQAATMNTVLGSLKIPPASLPVFPVLFIMILAPIYDRVIIPLARRVTKTEMGISHLQRIGTGLVFSIVAMAVAALVEIKRKQVAFESNLVDSNDPLPITFLWVALQYLFLGSADLFTLAGLLEFFFTEAPASMRSMATALSWASLALGYYLSSMLVSIVNNVTGTSTKTPWLSGSNLNHYHLDRFYWLMCVLSGLNFLQFIFWANQYKYRPIVSQN